MEQQNGLPIEQNNSAKYAFFYLLSLVALIFMALSTGMIIFQIINKTIVDIPLFSGGFDSGTLRFAISAIIISAPIYYLTMRQINKSLYNGSLHKDAEVRKWLTYFILLVSAVVMIGWLIATINNFLNGELTTKFILKAITAIIIAAAIFSYYFYDIRRESVIGAKDKTISLFFYGSLAIVVISLISAFFFIDSPTVARERRQDMANLEKFNMIDNAINSYYAEHGKLPANFADITGDKTIANLSVETFKDEITGKAFDYKGKDKMTYELCTEFKTSNKDVNDIGQYNYKDRWTHDAGYQCMSQRVMDVKGTGPVPTPK